MNQGVELISLLNKLRLRLNSSGVETTEGLKDAIGTNCHHYSKSMDLFLSKDYVDLRNLIQLLEQKFDLLEGGNNT